LKTTTLLFAALVLTGCAGLDVTYQLQANYISKELAAKRQADADKEKAEALAERNRIEDERRFDDLLKKMP
jgi:hypothetical protein